jgi:hypothetical protein
MSNHNCCRYQSLPQHQLNELLNQRNEALRTTHGNLLPVFPRTSTEICQEIRGETEWETMNHVYSSLTIPFDRPQPTHCENITTAEHRYLNKKYKDSYLKHPKHMLGYKTHELERRIIPPFLVTNETACNMGTSLWNYSTRLDS